MRESEFERQSLATARVAVLVIAAFLAVALALGIANGTIHFNMFDHPPPSPNDPITIP